MGNMAPQSSGGMSQHGMHGQLAPDSWSRDAPGHPAREVEVQHEKPLDGQPMEHIEVLIEADKRLLQKVRMDVDLLRTEIEQLEGTCRQEEHGMDRERDECERIGSERQHLIEQLDASRRQLASLKQERQVIQSEGIQWRRHHGHAHQEASFQKRLHDEGLRDMQALNQSIEYLERSNQNLISHSQSLEETLGEVRARVLAESTTLERERREASRAKQALDALRNGRIGTTFSGWDTSGTDPWGASPSDAVQQPKLDPWASSSSNVVHQPKVGSPDVVYGNTETGQAATPWYAGLSLSASPGVGRANVCPGSLPQAPPLPRIGVRATTQEGAVCGMAREGV